MPFPCTLTRGYPIVVVLKYSYAPHIAIFELRCTADYSQVTINLYSGHTTKMTLKSPQLLRFLCPPKTPKPKTELFWGRQVFCWWIVTFDLGSSENTSLPVFSILRVHWMNRWRRSTSYTKVLWVWRGRATALAVGLVHGHRKAQSERISVARDTKSWVSQQKNNLPFVRSSIVSQLPQNSRNPFIQDENICPNINVGRAPAHQLIPHSPIQPKSSKKRGEI